MSMRFLLFTLYAPMGSFGEIATGELRMSAVRPARSAVMGLVAAALGIRRPDEGRHQALQRGLWCAVQTDAGGQALTDYHTAQAPSARKGVVYHSRREELAASSLNTVISRREWRTDSFFTVALWRRGEGGPSLEDVARSLRRPAFQPYCGRKSGPLGLPTNPEVIEADNLMEALAARQRSPVEEGILRRLRPEGDDVEIAFDADAIGVPDVEGRIERRRDVIESRQRWQFSNRQERIATVRHG